MRDTMSGEGPWTIVLWNGRPSRVEIETEGRTIVVRTQLYDSECARCGRFIRASTPKNEDMDCCAACERQIEEEYDRG